MQMLRSHEDFGLNEISQKIENNKHLKLDKDVDGRKVRTKKKRNFIEDLPMNLHVDDSEQQSHLEEGEEHKESEMVLEKEPEVELEPLVLDQQP